MDFRFCGATLVCGLFHKSAYRVGDCSSCDSFRLWCACLVAGSLRCYRDHLLDHSAARSFGDFGPFGFHEEDAVLAENF
ncbi:hypothetical protein D3C87_1403900 [compost metagenome]